MSAQKTGMGLMYSIYLANAGLGGGAQVMLAQARVCACMHACAYALDAAYARFLHMGSVALALMVE